MILRPKATSKRIDHHGIVAGVIHDIGLIQAVDDLIPEYGNEDVSVGHAVASMIINGLGFTDRALSMTEEFFELLPTERLIGTGVEASHLNRWKLARTLDHIHKAGCSNFFSSVASHAAIVEGVSRKVQSLDTTSFSLTGRYDEESDTEEIEVKQGRAGSTEVKPDKLKVVHGHSKDHRPDLRQVVAEMIVSHDGDVPLVLSMHNGNSSDSTIFKERCEAIKEQFDSTQLLVADSKLYSKDNSLNLASIKFVTRIPEVLAIAKAKIIDAVKNLDQWYAKEKDFSYTTYSLEHYGIEQNWMVCTSSEAISRATKTIEKKVEKEKQEITRSLFHLQATRFACQDDALASYQSFVKKWQFHDLSDADVTEIKLFSKKGRPAKDAEPERVVYQVNGSFSLNKETVETKIKEKACFIIGTNDLTQDPDKVIATYKAQGSVERGFRFLKDPTFFASSMFLKKPERIEALVTIMTLSLLVYTLAQRRLRNALSEQEAFVPNSSGKAQKKPTLKRVFQLFQGVTEIKLVMGGLVHTIVDGLTELRLRVLQALGGKALEIYSE